MEVIPQSSAIGAAVRGLEGFPYITEIVKTETDSESFVRFWHRRVMHRIIVEGQRPA